MQTFAVALWSLLLFICSVIFFMLCAIPALWPFIGLYVVFIYFDKSPEHGGRVNPWVRGHAIWKYFADYYPASLRKEAELPADRPYVFGYHPHGIIGMGAFASFATEGTGFSKNFPGIRPHLLTLASNLSMPIYREVLLRLGICSVSKQSCSNILKQGDGSAICIVVGGAAESLAARPGTADLTLKKRLGFIKIAIQHGAALVPVFSFGENDIFEQLSNEKGTTVYNIQKRFQATFGFTMPLFHGRGLLNYNFGLMPHRRTIVSVFGRPIKTEKCEQPTKEMIEEIQQQYIDELMRIWNTYKDSYARSRKRELRIIE